MLSKSTARITPRYLIGPDPVLEYSLDTPPLILTPTDKAGITDGRARFREIYCAVQEDHGDTFPDDLPCEQVLHRLSGESEPTKKPVHLDQARLPLRVLVVPGTMAECIQETNSPWRQRGRWTRRRRYQRWSLTQGCNGLFDVCQFEGRHGEFVSWRHHCCGQRGRTRSVLRRTSQSQGARAIA